MKDARERLIVALDVSSAVDAQEIIATLGDSVTFYKVGKQLFTAEGPRVVHDLVEGGRKVFLDLKFHDIPNTVAGAVHSASQLGVSMITVHASGGSAMLRAAVESAAKAATPPLILAVTVLTSMDKAALEETGVTGTVQSQVLRLAELALNAGCGGVVASAQEAAEIRRELGSGFAIVTPGIRPAGGDVGDQARVVTPSAALKAGATHLVVGRPITAAALPAQAAQQILQEMNQACAAG
ncbi:MAG TPA: orotidine-5'-phosphate decarboxylase [candidate division Zixibacteria bacterium]|nr:orotidine-5'-phosphate decarboxylase [candidate division Zixibacteria bacterium]